MDHPVLDIFDTDATPRVATRRSTPLFDDARASVPSTAERAEAPPPASPARASDAQREQTEATACSPCPPSVAHVERIITTSADRIAWLRARAQGVTATDVARLTGPKSIESVAREKRGGGPWFSGNAATAHGRAREPHIAAWVADHFSIQPSNALFHAEVDRRHLATPDGIADDGMVLAEIKTTTRDLEQIPAGYLRQIWWQQHVLGAERTLFVWEQHVDFVPIGRPRFQWVERDDEQIAVLVERATTLLSRMFR